MEFEFSSQIFEKYCNMIFHWNPFSVSRDVPCGQTDMTKQIVSFRNFENAPKNGLICRRNREKYCVNAVSGMRLRWSEARGTGFTPRPSLSWCRILNWPGGPTGKVSTFLTGMKIRYERSLCDWVIISILFWEIIQLRYSNDRRRNTHF